MSPSTFLEPKITLKSNPLPNMADAFDLNDSDVVDVYDDLPLWSSVAGQMLLRHVPLSPRASVLGCRLRHRLPDARVGGRIRSMLMPRRNHHTESFERLNKLLGEANGTPLSERIARGKPRSWNRRSKAVKAGFSALDSIASHNSRYREA